LIGAWLCFLRRHFLLAVAALSKEKKGKKGTGGYRAACAVGRKGNWRIVERSKTGTEQMFITDFKIHSGAKGKKNGGAPGTRACFVGLTGCEPALAPWWRTRRTLFMADKR